MAALTAPVSIKKLRLVMTLLATAGRSDSLLNALSVLITGAGATLALNSGRPEMSFVARSKTRFVSASVFAIEFQLDGQGKVIGATWEQGRDRIPLERK
jgi:hypothetical protein